MRYIKEHSVLAEGWIKDILRMEERLAHKSEEIK
jgi:hypothetical protein